MPESTLPQLISSNGEVVRLVTAGDLLAVAGLGTEEELRAAELEAIGVFDDNAKHLEQIAKEARGITGAEALRRMDRSGTWTLRADGFEFKAPSPSAGTTKYDTEQLLEQLGGLVARDLIDPEAMDAAVEEQPGTVPITLEHIGILSLAITPSGNVDSTTADEQRSAGLMLLQALAERIPKATHTQRPAGLNALKKLGGEVAAAVEACKVDVAAPTRTVSVKRKDTK